MDAKLSYREQAARGASPVHLVMLLYEQAIEDLHRALVAQRQGQIEERFRQVDHALLVLGYLQATLDKEHGGRVAANLEQFYNQIRAGLMEAQCRQSAQGIEQQISHLMLVREAWEEVERATPPGAERTIRESGPGLVETGARSSLDRKA